MSVQYQLCLLPRLERRKEMRKFTLLTSILLTAPFAVGNVTAQCVATQDCESLGYTETSCENGGIKCPFGDKWACKGNADPGMEGSDTGMEGSDTGRDNPDCTYGAIYYSDGTCVKDFISEKIPIGVVVYMDTVDNEKWIMALDNAASNVKWSTEDVDVPEITNYTIERTVVSDLKSCENTEAMLALGESKYPAAAAAKNYAPAGAESTKGKWCLPSAGIWNMVNNHRTEIDAAISRASGTSLGSSSYFWSLSEISSNSAWYWRSSGAFSSSDKYYGNYDVRPVLAI